MTNPTEDELREFLSEEIAAWEAAPVKDSKWVQTRIRNLRSLLERLSAPGVGDWQLVPREADSRMIQAAEQRMVEGASYLPENGIVYALWQEVWRALLANAPKPTPPAQGDVERLELLRDQLLLIDGSVLSCNDEKSYMHLLNARALIREALATERKP